MAMPTCASMIFQYYQNFSSTNIFGSEIKIKYIYKVR